MLELHPLHEIGIYTGGNFGVMPMPEPNPAMKRDAAESPWSLIPDGALLPKELVPTRERPQRWGDGGRVTGGAKPHLDDGVATRRPRPRLIR
jgi:hypothetical protein